jgi:hypothetical protein
MKVLKFFSNAASLMSAKKLHKLRQHFCLIAVCLCFLHYFLLKVRESEETIKIKGFFILTVRYSLLTLLSNAISSG